MLIFWIISKANAKATELAEVTANAPVMMAIPAKVATIALLVIMNHSGMKISFSVVFAMFPAMRHTDAHRPDQMVYIYIVCLYIDLTKKINPSLGCRLCSKGWHLEPKRGGCIDIDECADPIQPCKVNQFCVNNEGSYSCLGMYEL